MDSGIDDKREKYAGFEYRPQIELDPQPAEGKKPIAAYPQEAGDEEVGQVVDIYDDKTSPQEDGNRSAAKKNSVFPQPGKAETRDFFFGLRPTGQIDPDDNPVQKDGSPEDQDQTKIIPGKPQHKPRYQEKALPAFSPEKPLKKIKVDDSEEENERVIKNGMGDLEKARRGEGEDQGRDPGTPSVKNTVGVAIEDPDGQQ